MNTRDIQGAGKGPGKALGRVGKADTEVWVWVLAVGDVPMGKRTVMGVQGEW